MIDSSLATPTNTVTGRPNPRATPNHRPNPSAAKCYMRRQWRGHAAWSVLKRLNRSMVRVYVSNPNSYSSVTCNPRGAA